MPRPKPPEPLLITSVRLTRRQQIQFRRLGGSAWLRQMINAYQRSAPETDAGSTNTR